MASPRTRRLATAGVLFALLVFIALYVRDRYVRPHGGDLLVVVFLHLLLRAMTPLGRWTAAAAVFGLACAMELAQAFGLASALGLRPGGAAEVALGAHADWVDLGMYALGALVAVALDRRLEDRAPAAS